ncbi:SGNH/GDSL hydrolase family protein [Olivibacter domesticus]|uniref:GDSL-like Lipase/Acylhydrolase n=1 Tax=Olivibacter domesticus TaxID=407022 RepID=A0A1H7LTU0_OLID1|nr:SGNH/GDSL hydrolase family protein [Olivibacter domesticus]SEL02342.1 GDSL-like Lipase/Acylhydrolase [Olivibacter domesticus]
MKKILILLTLTFFLTSFTPKEIKWIAIGDSITYLNDHLDETGNRVTKGYMTRVIEKKPALQYLNQGHNGWTAVKIAKNIDQLGLTKADIYSVFLGTNDWWAGLPLGTIKDYTNDKGNATVYGAFRIIVNKIKRLNNQAEIVLITPMQRTDFIYIGDMHNNAWGSYKEKAGQSLEQFAEAIKTIGKQESFQVIDLYHNNLLALPKLVKYKRLKDPLSGSYNNYKYPTYTTIPFNPAADEYPYPIDAIDMTYDGLHPSDKGNQLIADALLKVFKRNNQ